MDNNQAVTIRVEVVRPGFEVEIEPTLYDCDFDLELTAAIPFPEIIKRGEYKYFPTGFRVFIPPGYQGHLKPRTDWAVGFGISILNSSHIFDNNFNDEIFVCLCNQSDTDMLIKRGDIIASLIISNLTKIRVELIPLQTETASPNSTSST